MGFSPDAREQIPKSLVSRGLALDRADHLLALFVYQGFKEAGGKRRDFAVVPDLHERKDDYAERCLGCFCDEFIHPFEGP